MKVFVCAARAAKTRKIAASVRRGGFVGAIVESSGLHLRDELLNVFATVRGGMAMSGGEPHNVTAFRQCEEGEEGLVLLDHDLAALEFRGARLTAEDVAGYLRAVSGAQYVVVLDRVPWADFDMEWLTGGEWTAGDLELNTRHLANPGLWARERAVEGAFLPWYWPELGVAAERRRWQIALLEASWDRPVVDVLGLTAEVRNGLSARSLAGLSPAVVHGRTKNVTVRRFFLESCAGSLPIQAEREVLAKKAAGGDRWALRVGARCAAAEMEKWVRRELAAGEVVLDLPHLVARNADVVGVRREGAGGVERGGAGEGEAVRVGGGGRCGRGAAEGGVGRGAVGGPAVLEVEAAARGSGAAGAVGRRGVGRDVVL